MEFNVTTTYETSTGTSILRAPERWRPREHVAEAEFNPRQAGTKVQHFTPCRTPSQSPVTPRTMSHELSFGNTGVTAQHGNRDQHMQAGFCVRLSQRDPVLP